MTRTTHKKGRFSAERFVTLGMFTLFLFLASGCLVRERLESATVAQNPKGVLFVYDDLSANEVWLAGQFNHWAAKKGDRFLIEMKQGEDGLWRAVIPYREYIRDPEFDELDDDIYVQHGRRYQYKFVIDQNRWVTDPNNRSLKKNPDGTENSLLVAP